MNRLLFLAPVLLALGCSSSEAEPDTSGAGGADGGTGGTGSGGLSRPLPRGDELCGKVPGGSSRGPQVLRFESENRATAVQIERADEGPGAGESRLFGLTAFGIRRLDMGSAAPCSATELAYENSHHNWADRASATQEGQRYELAMDYEPGLASPWNITLTGYDVDTGAVLTEPISLIPTGGPVLCYECPSHVPVLITEIMPLNGTTLADEHGDFDPWIELFNPSADDVKLTGWALSIRPGERNLVWTFPDVTIRRHETLVVFADSDDEQGALHAGISLNANGGFLALSDPRGVSTGGFTWGMVDPDVSFGLAPDLEYGILPSATPGRRNPGFE